MDFKIKNISRFVVVGDRVLLKPEEETNKTTTGLFLPPEFLKKKKFKVDLL